MISHRDYNELVRRMSRIEQGLLQRPLRGGGGGGSPVYVLVIDGGNLLADGITNGIRSTSFTTTPSLYDPNVTATGYQNGLGRGHLWINNVVQTGYVLIAYGFVASSLQLALVTGVSVLTSSATVSVPLVSDATQSITCFVPYCP